MNTRKVNLATTQGFLTKKQRGVMKILQNYAHTMKNRPHVTQVSVADDMHESLVRIVRSAYTLPPKTTIVLMYQQLKVVSQSGASQ